MVGPFLDEADHQRVPSQTQFLEIGELHEVLGECLQLVAVELEGVEFGEFCEFFGKVSESVVAKNQGCQVCQFSHLYRKFLQLVPPEVQVV